jgi:hypothetical protein
VADPTGASFVFTLRPMVLGTMTVASTAGAIEAMSLKTPGQRGPQRSRMIGPDEKRS